MKELDKMGDVNWIQLCKRDGYWNATVVTQSTMTKAYEAGFNAARSALDQVLAMQRGEIIEECAKVCQGLSAGYMRIGKVEQSDSCDECRDAIRALKG